MNKTESINYLLSPSIPTFKRYRKLFWRKGLIMSITRILQYEVLSRHPFTGKLLDIGGGERADYKNLLSFGTYESVNIDSALQPTWLVGVGKALPCGDEQYDIVLSMNTIEHIFDVDHVLHEVYRVLKSGGKFVASAPFLHPIHGHPDDFFRPTASWWYHSLSQIGFSEIGAMPLAWGPFSTGFVCSGHPGPGKVFRRHLTLLMDLLYTKLHSRLKSLDVIKNALNRLPLAFFITATK